MATRMNGQPKDIPPQLGGQYKFITTGAELNQNNTQHSELWGNFTPVVTFLNARTEQETKQQECKQIWRRLRKMRHLKQQIRN